MASSLILEEEMCTLLELAIKKTVSLPQSRLFMIPIENSLSKSAYDLIPLIYIHSYLFPTYHEVYFVSLNIVHKQPSNLHNLAVFVVTSYLLQQPNSVF